jgi:2-desacetyl-2-hydroxyethyl bacteriochlorophyllide A dehydrogenase
MQALWIEDGEATVRGIARPEPAAGEALVRVLQAGICNTDLELLAGYYAFSGVPGHEFVGRVEAGPDYLLGVRVVGEINVPCGECSTCRRGLPGHCDRRTVLGIAGLAGAFAEYLKLPVTNLHRVPDSVSDDAATFAEPLAAALQIEHQVEIGPRDRILVLGAGKLGQLIARALAVDGHELVVGTRSEAASELLRRYGIATIPCDGLPRRAYDVVVECTGDPAGFELARAALRPRGTLVLKSTYASELALGVSSLVVDEITLVGSRCGPMTEALDALAGGRIAVDDLVAARYPLARAREALAHAARPGTLKVLLTPGSS